VYLSAIGASNDVITGLVLLITCFG
jgi:hypothetical protein